MEMELDIKPQHQDQQPGIEERMDPKPVYIRQHYEGSGKLTGKVALITGGDSGIGRAVALHFAREGADLALAYYPSEETDAQTTKALVEAEGRRCLLVPGDLRKPSDIRDLVSTVLKTYNRVNVLVNNAANHVPQQDIAGITDEQLIDTFDLNVLAIFRLTQALLPTMGEYDCIINTTSVVSYKGSPALLDYSSTKGALTAFTRSLSQHLADKKIRVNAVAPGPIWTPLIVSSLEPQKAADFGKDTPMKRPGQPAELAPAFVFLASEDASYYTGQVIHVNGGDIINS
jgi:NAD(P)-dependent dehydrogenase (short-subunit alcohol dehydrogenase family)